MNISEAAKINRDDFEKYYRSAALEDLPERPIICGLCFKSFGKMTNDKAVDAYFEHYKSEHIEFTIECAKAHDLGHYTKLAPFDRTMLRKLIVDNALFTDAMFTKSEDVGEKKQKDIRPWKSINIVEKKSDE